jgi:hypothetical protein
MANHGTEHLADLFAQLCKYSILLIGDVFAVPGEIKRGASLAVFAITIG